jgi:hypothetical protein
LTKTTNTRFCQNTLSWLCGNSVLSIPVLVVAPKQDIRLLGGYISLRGEPLFGYQVYSEILNHSLKKLVKNIV